VSLRRTGRRAAGIGAVLVAAAALAGCGSSGSGGGGAVPYPKGSWSAGAQRTFMKACSATADVTFCACALGDVMQRSPNASSLHGSVAATGTSAATDGRHFSDCADL
jgi:hypothetical protein